MARDRRVINVKGLGSLSIRQIDPVIETDYTSVGYLQSTKLTDEYPMEDVIDETGAYIDFLDKGQIVTIETALLQTAQAQLAKLQFAAGKYHSIRYYGKNNNGSLMYFCFEQARIRPGISQEYKVGLRTLPAMIKALAQQELGFTLPMYYLNETPGIITIDGLNLWFDPRLNLNGSTAKILDISGFARHGSLSSAFATIWQGDGITTVPIYFLRFDGAVDNISLGDVLDIDATADLAIEFWLRVKGADGSLQEILGKKTDDTNTAGYRIVRTAANKIEFKVADGAANAVIITTGTVLTNVWKKIGLWIDRDGNGQLFVNGVADGAAVSVAGVGDASNALALILGQFNGNNGQIDLGSVRFYNFGAGNLPANFAALDAQHYAAEKSNYGL